MCACRITNIILEKPESESQNKTQKYAVTFECIYKNYAKKQNKCHAAIGITKHNTCIIYQS